MTTLNKEAPERQDLEALLPWHAAGTLARRDSDRLERALASDRDLALQYGLVREELNETIHLNELLGVPSSRCMEKLFAAIEAEGVRAPARRSFDLAGRVSQFMANFAPRTLAWSASAAAVFIVAQAAVLTTVVVKDQTYEIASAPTDRGVDTIVKIRFAPQATVADIGKFLDAHHAVVVNGPKQGGLYDVQLSGNPSEPELTMQLQRMQSESKVVDFIARVK